MNELGAAAGGALAEVALFEQGDSITAGCGVDRYADPGGTATNHGDIPRLVGRFEPLQLPRAIAISEHGHLAGS